MIKTLVIYDDNGIVFSQITGSYVVPQGGIQFAEIEIPEGKQVKGVDTSVNPHKIILEDIPKSDVELLKEQLKATQEAVDFLLMTGGM